MLQYKESAAERENSIRAAFNYYTQQLVFGDSYLLTASKEDRKRMIRSDQLPTLTAVITSDLDLRDLYRNQILTAMDDARAEVLFQMKQQKPEFEDTILFIKEAYAASEDWFALIPKEDLDEAMNAVSIER